MACRRCGTTTEPIDTISVRVNDTSEYLRAALCTDCRAVVRAAVHEAMGLPRAA